LAVGIESFAEIHPDPEDARSSDLRLTFAALGRAARLLIESL
jgi:hypothetical protein